MTLKPALRASTGKQPSALQGSRGVEGYAPVPHGNSRGSVSGISGSFPGFLAVIACTRPMVRFALAAPIPLRTIRAKENGKTGHFHVASQVCAAPSVERLSHGAFPKCPSLPRVLRQFPVLGPGVFPGFWMKRGSNPPPWVWSVC